MAQDAIYHYGGKHEPCKLTGNIMFPAFLFVRMGIIDSFYSLGARINKVKSDTNAVETEEGVISDLMPAMRIDTENEEIEKLATTWKSNWDNYKKDLEIKQEDNEKYWKGEHFSPLEMSAQERPIVDNLIFESLETFLPIATAKNPEPVVSMDDSKEGSFFAGLNKDILVYLADILRLKNRLKTVVRYWSLYLVGISKITWDEREDEMTVQTIRPSRIILNPESTINEDMEYTGDYIGEYKQDTVEDLLAKFGSKTKEITSLVANDKRGSKVQYIEWWTDSMVFWTLKGKVFNKIRNPHFNYDEETKNIAPLNHFKRSKKPYIFLSIFNLGKHPHDETSLIGQNLSSQDLINKRVRQIDRNVDFMNGGWGVSGASGLDKEAAQKMIHAARYGGGLFVPTGKVSDVLSRIDASPLPGDVYQSLADARLEIRNIFGVRGSTPEGTVGEQTVRGKLIIKGQDSSRIGGGITEYLEQYADQIFNWFIQMIYVYYDTQNLQRILGDEKTAQYSQLLRLAETKALKVSVKEGSLIPKDDLTKRNEAIDLWSAGALDPITLFERLDDPNPYETAKKLFLWKTMPQLLFAEDQEAQNAAAMAQQQKLMQEGGVSPPQPQNTPDTVQSGSGDVALNQVPIQ